MRNMSFALTTQQFKDRTKTVTRRLGWWNIKTGELLMGVEKSQGIKKGEKIVRLGVIRVVSVRKEQLGSMIDNVIYGLEEIQKEGFGDIRPMLPPYSWVEWFCATHKGCTPDTEENRIEFKYVDDPKITA